MALTASWGIQNQDYTRWVMTNTDQAFSLQAEKKIGAIARP